MGYPPPPPPPGQPGGYGPPSGPPGYGGAPPGPQPPPGGPGYGAPPGGPPPGGYGGPPGGYAPGPPPSSGSSKGPLIALMAAIVVVVLLAVVGGLILLGRSGGGDVELTSDQRLDALLTEGDLGGSFTEDPEDDDESTDEDLEASAECEDLLDRLDEEGANPFSEGDDPAGAVARSFTDESGATVEQGLAPTIDLVDTYGELIDACDELTFEEDGASATVSFAEGDAFDLGDDSITAEVHFSYSDGEDTIEFDSYVVVWTDRGTDGFLAFGPGVDDEFDPVEIDTATVEDLATTAADKLSEVIDEA
jgi:hypothetical protein